MTLAREFTWSYLGGTHPPPALETLPREAPFAIGELLAETYRIVGVLGVGGMGMVYEADDVDLHRRVALKVVFSPKDVQALRREAQVLAAIHHPNVVTVHALGRDRDRPFVVLERLTGRTLRARIEEANRDGRPMEVGEVIDLLAAIADALSTVHRVGLWHRDLKSDNVILSGSRVVLVDFGLFSPDRDDDQALSGTPEYVAPELLLETVRPGEMASTDLYALGVLAYEMLVGSTPFVSPTVQRTLLKHVSQPVPDVTILREDVPSELAALIGELLAKLPEDRPSGSEEVLWRLRAIRTELDADAARPLRVLLVDDDDDLLRVLQRSLRRALPGLVVDATTNARGALEAIAGADIVVTDLAMPEMTGMELTMTIAALPAERRPTVVAMSAVATSADREVLRSLGAAHFVPKGDHLVATICAIVGDRRRARARATRVDRRGSAR